MTTTVDLYIVIFFYGLALAFIINYIFVPWIKKKLAIYLLYRMFKRKANMSSSIKRKIAFLELADSFKKALFNRK